MKKITILAMLAIGATATFFTACTKDIQENTKQAQINPLKDIKKGTTYTFYGQTEKNLENEEICRMQLTMGDNGEWTINREIISNRMLKSTVDLIDVVALHVPEEYISYSDDYTTEFTFPTNDEIKYYFIPFEVVDKKSASSSQDPLQKCSWLCGCVKTEDEIPQPGELCSKDRNIKDKSSEAYQMSCVDTKYGMCAQIEGGTCRAKKVCVPVNPPESDVISQTATYTTYSQGVLLPARSFFVQ